MNVDYTVNSDGNILFKGSLPVKMTAYEITPPKAMMGTIKTGDDIVISFEVTFKK